MSTCTALGAALAPACGPDCKTLRTCPDLPEGMAGSDVGSGGAGGESGDGSGGHGDGGSSTSGGTASSGGAGSGGNSNNPERGGADSGGGSTSGGASAGGKSGGGGGSGGMPAECGELVCPKHATCVVESMVAGCQCDSGYAPAGADDLSCEDVDECEDDPCGEGGTCEDEPGGFSCSCKDGFYDDLGSCWPDMVLVSAVGENLGAPGGAEATSITFDGRHISFRGLGSDFGLDQDDMKDAIYQDMRGGKPELVATPPQGEGSISVAQLSADGSTVAFSSTLPGWVSGDTNDASDVFVKRIDSPTISRVSVSSMGVQADSDSSLIDVSADGKRVIFTSSATNLVPGDANGQRDLFVRDLDSEATTRSLVILPGGTEPAENCGSWRLSPDGDFLAMWCGFTYYVHDLQQGTTEFVADGSSAASPMGESWVGGISEGGRYVSYGAGEEGANVFVRDMVQGTVELISVTTDGEESVLSRPEDISGDGRYVLFSSGASNLVEDDTNDTKDLFLRDRLMGTTTLVSTGPDGQQSNSPTSYGVLSGDGRFLLFSSTVSNFGTNPQGIPQVWYKRILP